MRMASQAARRAPRDLGTVVQVSLAGSPRATASILLVARAILMVDTLLSGR